MPDRGMAEQVALHLGGRHVLSADLEHVLEPADEGDPPVRVHDGHVHGVEPALVVEYLRRQPGVVQVAGEAVRAAEQQLALGVRRQADAGDRVDDPAFHAGHRVATGSDPLLQRVGQVAQRQERGRLGHPDAGHLDGIRQPAGHVTQALGALRLGRGARGVHDDGGVADLGQLTAALQVAVWHAGPAAAKSASAAKPGGRSRPRTTTWRRSGASSRASAVRSWPARAGNAADSRPGKSGAPETAGSGGLMNSSRIRECRIRSASSRLLYRALTGTGYRPALAAPNRAAMALGAAL
jgi:hypothetical protein